MEKLPCESGFFCSGWSFDLSFRLVRSSALRILIIRSLLLCHRDFSTCCASHSRLLVIWTFRSTTWGRVGSFLSLLDPTRATTSWPSSQTRFSTPVSTPRLPPQHHPKHPIPKHPSLLSPPQSSISQTQNHLCPRHRRISVDGGHDTSSQLPNRGQRVSL
jgi:hypothetical protein